MFPERSTKEGMGRLAHLQTVGQLYAKVLPRNEC